MANNRSTSLALGYAKSILGDLPSDWKYARVGDLEAEGIIEDVQDGNHGERHPKSSDYVAIGVPFIMAKDIINNRLDLTGCNFISREQADSLRIGFARPGDVLLTHKATMGRVAIVPDGHDYVMLTPQVTYYRISDKRQLDARYLKYAFISPRFQHQLNASSDQSTRKFIGITAQRDLWFPLPPPLEQKRIAEILGTLDDKIELNRRMNETLEAMARRLFKSWFVDFDPVHAKAALRRQHRKLSNADHSRRALPNIAPEIAELFPDSFEDSALGLIPQGWSTRPLYDIANFVNGAAFKNSDFCDPSMGKPVIKIAELKSGIDAQTKFSQKEVGSDREIRRGDTLYSWSGSPDTSLATFRWTGRDGILNQHIFKVITESRPDAIYAYYQLNDLRDTLVEIARNKQTTGLGHVTVADMKRLHVIQPSPEVLEAFANTAGPIYDESFNLSVDSLTLEKTRDKLLPRLLSGELQLTDI